MDYDLNKPAFGEGSEVIKPDTGAEVETVVETPVIPEAAEETSEEESKVPYSRFKKFHDEAIRLRAERDEWMNRRDEIKPEAPIDLQDEAYKLWIENYGDNEAAHKAWKNQLKITETLETRAMQRAEERALEAVRQAQYEEVRQIDENVEVIDSNLDSLTEFVGRDLTETEQSALLDIVDDYTPKDSNGNYAGALLPMDKAWEIYELKQQNSKAPKIESRNAIARLSGAQSQGSTTITDKDVNFNPRDWNAWKNRI